MTFKLKIQYLLHKVKHIFRNRKYDVYCPYCSSCGETGCCKPTICVNHPKGFYCERNTGEVRASFYTLNEFYEWLYYNKDNSELTLLDVYNKLNEIEDKNDDELEEYLKNLPEKLTFIEKIKKWINN